MNDSEILRQIEAQHEESRAFPRTVNRFVAVVPFVKRDASVREVSAGVVALDSKTSLPSASRLGSADLSGMFFCAAK